MLYHARRAADDTVGHVAGNLRRALVGKRGRVCIDEQGGAHILEACMAPVTCQATSLKTHISLPRQSSVTCWLGLICREGARRAYSEATLPGTHLTYTSARACPGTCSA